MNKIWNLIYPPVRQDIKWHRVVFVIGWILSIMSLALFPLVFILYFGAVQRIIFYIVYGEDESKWQRVK